jgi:hypothetical protein
MDCDALSFLWLCCGATARSLLPLNIPPAPFAGLFVASPFTQPGVVAAALTLSKEDCVAVGACGHFSI